MRVADAIWTATALLHRENPSNEDFEVQEIVSRAVLENLVGGFRPGLQPHASWHCVANKKPNGGRYRMLYETARGRRRLFHAGDEAHPDRNGDIRPDKSELPTGYRTLVDWYETVYSKQSSTPNAALAGEQLRSSRESGRQDAMPVFSDVNQVLPSAAYVTSAGAFVIPEDLRKELGIQEGTRLGIYREKDRLILQPITKEYIRSLVGCAKGETSLVEAREREHRAEK
jgi:AbrB family looped-hinge helix DNA binding protein